MKRIVFICFQIFLLFQFCFAQPNGLIGKRTSKNESIEFTIGPGYCFGDQFMLPTKMPFALGDNWDMSLGYRRMYSTNFGYKVTLQYGSYGGYDESTRCHDVGYLCFNSDVTSASLRGEYSYNLGQSSYDHLNLLSFYTFLGLGILNSNVTFAPSAYQGKSNTVAGTLPFGGGLKYHLNENLSLGTEFNYQYVFSDYVDGYSPAVVGNNDVLLGLSFTFEYQLF